MHLLQLLNLVALTNRILFTFTIHTVQGRQARILTDRGKFQRAHAWSPDLDQHTDGKLRRRRVPLSRPNFDLGPWIRVKSVRIRALRAELRSPAYYSCVPSIHACSKKDKAVYSNTILAWPPRTRICVLLIDFTSTS